MKIKIFLMTLLFITVAASQADAPLYDTMEEMRMRLLNITKENIKLRVEVRTWKEVAASSIEENRLHVVSNEIIQYFRNAGYSDPNNPYARDPAHLQKIYKYALKYKSLLTAEAAEVCKKGQIVPEVFTMVWIAQETHYNPTVECHNKDETGRVISIDRNLTQINSGSKYDEKTKKWDYSTEAWDYGFSKLPDHLKNKKCNVYTDEEIGVAMFFIWINERVRCKKAFAYSSWGWTLYANINRALEKYKNDVSMEL